MNFVLGTLYTLDGTVVVRFGGRVAQILIFRDYNTGIDYDIHPDDASTRVTSYTGGLT